MIEKLLESWLDSASERSYQAVFVQMLSAEGFRVVHSTRHTALEFGKDVLAVAKDGIGCAYQLKGNPGGKLGLAEFRAEIQPQLIQLISQPVVYPGFPEGAHRAYLVSNGYFEEEVQRAVDDLNRGGYRSQVMLLSRGDLLELAKKHGAAIWPSELQDTLTLLSIFLADPRGLLPTSKLSALLEALLGLEEHEAHKRMPAPELRRRVGSAALLVGIASARFAEQDNHLAVFSAWTLFAIQVIGACERHQTKITGSIESSLNLAEHATLDALTRLWKEVRAKGPLTEGNLLSDPDVHGWRSTLVQGLLSCLALWDDVRPILSEDERHSLQNWLRANNRALEIWGEASIANLVPWLLWLRRNDATLRPDLEIAAVAEFSITQNQPDGSAPLASPYYDFEEVFRFKNKLDKSGEANALQRETLGGTSFVAQTLMHLLVRTKLKQRCKALWSDFTRISHRALAFDASWQYCKLRTKTGIDVTRLYPLICTWDALRAEALTADEHPIPSELTTRFWLIPCWWQIAPHRLSTASSRRLAESVLPMWGT